MQKIYVSSNRNLVIQIESPEFTVVGGKRIPTGPGKAISFTNGRYVTSDPKEIALLVMRRICLLSTLQI